MQLRDYQQQAVNSVYQWFSQNKEGNPLIVLPTGSGKSVVIAEIIRSAMEMDRSQRFIVTAHVKELIKQNAEKLQILWGGAPIGLYSAGLGLKQPRHSVVFGGIQSIYKKARVLGHRDLMICDEVHVVNNEGMYAKFIEELKEINPNIRLVGLSATPYRMKGGHITNQGLFTGVCYELPITKLIEGGYLSPVFTSLPGTQVDLSGVRTVAGEYNQKDMQAAFMKDNITARALDDVFSRAGNRKSFLFFCAGVDHAIETHEMLKARGLKGNVVHEGTHAREREQSISRLRNGEYDYLTNNAVLTTGTDIPRIDCVVLLRSTKSRGLYVQCVGRGMRMSPGKDCLLVLDYGGNVERFGPIDNMPEDNPGGKSGREGAPFKYCENDECNTVNHAKATECIACGYVFPQEEPHGDVAAEGFLVGPPPPEWYSVSQVTCKPHISRKSGKETLRIDYAIKGRATVISEWMTFNMARHRLKDWVSTWPSAETIKELSEELNKHAEKPVAILALKEEKYWRVLAYDFDNDIPF